MTDLFGDATEYDKALQQGLKLTGDDKIFYVAGRLAFLSSLLPPGFAPRRVLDFGCGAGETTERLADMFPTAHVVGQDLSEEIVAEARSRHATPNLSFQATLDAIERQSLDLCYSNGAIHHIPPAERPAVLRTLHQLSRPGGTVAIFENNPWNPGTRLVMRRIPFDRDAQPISAPALRRLLGEAGFKAEPGRYLFVFPAALRWLRPIERFLTRIPAGAQYVVVARRPA